MDENQARSLLLAERAEVQRLLAATEEEQQEAREAEVESESGDFGDAGLPLTEEGTDEAIADTLSDRLAQVDRALKRLDEGTYGRSIRSGQPIPDERLEADPAAELTVTEAAEESAAR
jgi:DnaK suppressor protein